MEKHEFDFVVCGAGISGMIAAVAAARRGLRVALINDRSVPGGNASSEIGVVIQGSCHHGTNSSVYAKETGLMDELRSKLDYAVACCGYDSAAAADAVFLDFIYNEPDITMFLNTVVTDVEISEGRIRQVLAYQMKEDRSLVFSAPYFADCTGDAVVAFKAGAEVMMGSEARDSFNEKSAGDTKESYTMGNTLYFEIEDIGQAVKFVRPEFAYDVSKMEFMKNMNDPEKLRFLYVGGRFWTLEYGGQVNTISDNEHINLELRRLVFGLWDYIKNSGKYPEAENFKIKRVYSVAGTRESRRIVGEYILTENDIDNKTIFTDNVLTGGWPLDLHAPKGIYDDLPASAFIPVTSLYSIPYRCLYSKDIKNLFMAGRDISVTHIALSSARVMGTCGAMGQAIGTAAALCAKYKTETAVITRKHIAELQSLLIRDDQHILSHRETGDENVESAVSVTVSHEKAYENLGDEIEQPLDAAYGLGLPIKTPKLNSVSLKLRNRSKKEQTVTVRILTGSRPEAYIADRILAERELVLQPGFCGFKEIHVGCGCGDDSKLYIVCLKNESVSVLGTKTPLPGAVTFRYYTERSGGFSYNSCPLSENTGFIAHDILIRDFNMCFAGVLPEQHMFSADNLFNGYTRPYRHANAWVADCGKEAEIFLEFKEPKWINELHIFFDNELEDDRRAVVPPGLVREYSLCVSDGETEREIVCHDNFMRHGIAVLKQRVLSIRVRLLSTWGRDFFTVYGIKLFDSNR